MSSNTLQLALTRFPWILHVAFVAAVGYLGARTLNVFVGDKIRPPVKLTTGVVVAAKSTVRPDLSAEAFAKMMGMQLPEPVAPEPGSPEDLAAGGAAPRVIDMKSEPIRTSLHAQLLATVVANKPEWSIATLRDLNQNSDDVYMQHDPFMGAEVLDVEDLRVILVVDGHREFLDLSAPNAVAVAPKSNGEPPPTNMDGVKKLDDKHYTITRSTVDGALANMNDLAMSARIVPSFKNGQANGFKLFSIKPDSLYSKIGIQNGDVIQRINGLDINSPDKALEAYGKLKSANALDLTVERNGATVTTHYGIQ